MTRRSEWLQAWLVDKFGPKQFDRARQHLATLVEDESLQGESGARAILSTLENLLKYSPARSQAGQPVLKSTHEGNETFVLRLSRNRGVRVVSYPPLEDPAPYSKREDHMCLVDAKVVTFAVRSSGPKNDKVGDKLEMYGSFEELVGGVREFLLGDLDQTKGMLKSPDHLWPPRLGQQPLEFEPPKF